MTKAISTSKRLRMSAQEIQKLIFSEMELHDLVFWLGYRMLGQFVNELKMARALEPLCNAKHSTIRRWINGQAKPNGTNTLMLYTSVMANYYNGQQEDLVYDFVSFARPDLVKQLFEFSSET